MSAINDLGWRGRTMRLFAILCIVVLLSAGVCVASAYADEFAQVGETATTAAPWQVKAKNASGKASKVQLYEYRGEVGSKTVSGYDVTGDGKPDTLVFSFEWRDTSPYESYDPIFKVSVNGKVAYTEHDDEQVVHLVTLKNGKSFILICHWHPDGAAYSGCYRYKGGKLKTVFASKVALDDFEVGAWFDLMPRGNKVIVSWWVDSFGLGSFKASQVYKYKNGTLEKASKMNSLEFMASNGEYHKRSHLKTRVSLKAHVKPGSKNGAFKVKQGAKIKVTACDTSKGALYFKVKYGKKVGWVKAWSYKQSEKHGDKTMLVGTYLY